MELLKAAVVLKTPSQCVWMRRKASLTIHWDDYPNSMFFSYNPCGCSDNKAAPPSRVAGVEICAQQGLGQVNLESD